MNTGITFSSFDLFHSGHVAMLKEAKTNCDFLIVGLQTDPTIDRPEKNKPIQSLEERRIQLESVKYVDEIVLYDTEADLLEILNKIKPDVRVLGTDYINKDFTGKNLNIELFYHERNHPWSSSELRKRILKANG